MKLLRFCLQKFYPPLNTGNTTVVRLSAAVPSCLDSRRCLKLLKLIPVQMYVVSQYFTQKPWYHLCFITPCIITFTPLILNPIIVEVLGKQVKC